MKNEPHAVDVAVGRAIRRRRLVNGVSQAGLGAQIGVTFQQVQKYEKGTNRVSASTLMEIAYALHVDVRSFFDDIGPQGRKHPPHETTDLPAEFSITRETVSLNQAFALISDVPIRRKIVALVQAVAGSKSTDEDRHLHDAAE